MAGNFDWQAFFREWDKQSKLAQGRYRKAQRDAATQVLLNAIEDWRRRHRVNPAAKLDVQAFFREWAKESQQRFLKSQQEAATQDVRDKAVEAWRRRQQHRANSR